MELNWIKSHNNPNRSCEDVSIYTSKTPNAVTIAVRNDCSKAITNTDYACVAVTGHKMYFKGVKPSDGGYKLSKRDNDAKNATMVVRNPELRKWADTHAGDYKLYYDQKHELYYIDAE